MTDTTPTNFHNVVANIPVPTTLDEVPGALYAILDAWAEFGQVLEDQMNEPARNPVAALAAATAGGALGVLKMVVRPTIENMAQAIEANVLANDRAELAAFEADYEQRAADTPALEAFRIAGVDIDAPPTVDGCMRLALACDGLGDHESAEMWRKAADGIVAGEIIVDTDPTPAAGADRPAEVES